MTYLFLVLNHSPIGYSTFTPRTCHNGAIADGDVKAPSQDTVHISHGVCDVVSLTRTRARSEVDVNALVERAWRDSQRSPAHLGADLIDTNHLHPARWA